MPEKINLSTTVGDFIKKLEKNATAPLYELSYSDARKFLDNLQDEYEEKDEYKVEIIDKTIPVDSLGQINIRVVRPKESKEKLPAILYFHGGGWILGGKHSHDTFIKRLACDIKAAVIFLDYPLSPESSYPEAINQGYALLDYVTSNPEEFNINPEKIVLSGDSAGGNMAAVLAIKAKEGGRLKVKFQALFYPVTDASMDSNSYLEFKNGPWLTKKAMEWFWAAYAPDKNLRNNYYISPLKADVEVLRNLPPALIITAENDVLRDEGEAYAKKLQDAGVEVLSVRINGTIHDFMMLNALNKTCQTNAAFSIASEILKKVLHS